MRIVEGNLESYVKDVPVRKYKNYRGKQSKKKNENQDVG